MKRVRWVVGGLVVLVCVGGWFWRVGQVEVRAERGEVWAVKVMIGRASAERNAAKMAYWMGKLPPLGEAELEGMSVAERGVMRKVLRITQ